MARINQDAFDDFLGDNMSSLRDEFIEDNDVAFMAFSQQRYIDFRRGE